MQGCHYTLHSTGPEDDVKMHQIFLTVNLDFITIVHINLLLPHYCSSLKIAGVLAGIQFSI